MLIACLMQSTDHTACNDLHGHPASRRRRGAALALRFLGDLERSNRFTLAMKDVRIKVLQAREAATALQLARFAQLTAVVGQLAVRADGDRLSRQAGTACGV